MSSDCPRRRRLSGAAHGSTYTPGISSFSSAAILRSFCRARASICRIRSFVTPNRDPTCSSVSGSRPLLQAVAMQQDRPLAFVELIEDAHDHLVLPRVRQFLLGSACRALGRR